MPDHEKPSRAGAALRALLALMVGVLFVGIAAAPAKAAVKAAPRQRRRNEGTVVVPLRLVPRRAEAREPLPRTASLEDRVAAFVAEEQARHESAARPDAAAAPRLVLVREAGEAPDVLGRRRIAERFRAELALAGRDAPATLDALVAAVSWRSWDHLHRQLGRSHERTARATELLVRGILAGARPVADRS